MSSTAGNIIDAAITRLLVFDEGRTDIAQDDIESFREIDREVNRLYGLASMPGNELQRDDYLAVEEDLAALDANSQVTLSAYAAVPTIRTAADAPVNIVTKAQLIRARAELPPAVMLQGLVLTSAGRTGDPVATDVLTAIYTPIPGPLTDRAHFIGATTPSSAGSSKWPEWVGDDALIGKLAVYWALKSGDATEIDLAGLGSLVSDGEARFIALVRRL